MEIIRKSLSTRTPSNAIRLILLKIIHSENKFLDTSKKGQFFPVIFCMKINKRHIRRSWQMSAFDITFCRNWLRNGRMCLVHWSILIEWRWYLMVFAVAFESKRKNQRARLYELDKQHKRVNFKGLGLFLFVWCFFFLLCFIFPQQLIHSVLFCGWLKVSPLKP